MKTLLNAIRTALCAGLAAVAWVQPAAATPLARAKSFEGNINVVGTQASLQSKAGGAHVCDLVASAQAGITLPGTATVVSATLYWTGTGPAGKDNDVLLNGEKVSAPADRRYSSSIDGFSYFSAAADVTTLVQDKTSFTFAGLEVDVSDTYCSKKPKENSMVAGFALVVVYAHKDERYRTVNVYEGLQAIKNGSVTVQMKDYIPSAENTGAGKLGYIVWEGDKTGNQKGDYVTFAGQLLSGEPYIQKNNAFNSKSGANGDENSIGIDFDMADLAAPPARPADASAVFTTGSDRVLLGTAIVALPSARSADLAIKKSQAGEFKAGSEITYTLEVSNLGVRADSAVEVKDTLPAALAFVSAGGTDWTCSVSGQAVSCKYGKPLAPNGKASVQIKARITGEGKITNTATVSGTADGVPGNNSSTVEGTVSAAPTGKDAWVFTVGKCEPDVVIKPAGEAGCARFQGPVTAGSKPQIYLTRTVDEVAKPVDAAADKTLSVRFSLECNNPGTSAGTSASYNGVALGACLKNDTPVEAAIGTEASVKFIKGVASIPATFHYPDVGLVTLRMRDGAGNIVGTSFASVPAALRVEYRRVDGVLNPGMPGLADAAFAEAGEPFLAVVSAQGQDVAGPLPNFGRESGEHAAADRLQVTVEDEVAQKFLVSRDGWMLDKDRPGELKRTYVWNEAGMSSLAGSLESYLGVKSLHTAHEPVGRFYPQYFKTETAGGFACLKRMNCPKEEASAIVRASFSRQPFDVTVHAYGRNGPLQGFVSPLVPQITLSGVSAPGALGKKFDTGFVNGAAAASTERKLSYELANGYVARTGTRDWTPPTAVYVRASAPELRKTADGAQAVQITSADDAAREGGIMVINGRLMVGNVIGTPLAKTAVPLRAQYWSGMAWEQNSGVEETEPVSGSVEFSACRRSLRVGAAGDTCDPAIVKVLGAVSAKEVVLPMLHQGRANLVLAPVAADKSGTVELLVDGEDYLPSTVGKVTFGQFKSPLIYIREMY